MMTNELIKDFTVLIFTTAFSLATIQSAYAQPGTLASAPLFLSNSVEPNMMLSLDDSTSMGREVLMSNPTAGFATTGGSPIIWEDGRWRSRHHLFSWGGGVVPPADRTWNCGGDPADNKTPEWDNNWVIFNHHANKVYYNPEFDYKPWPGVDAGGNALYADANPLAVVHEPWDPTATPSINITTAQTEVHNYNDDSPCTTTNRWYPVYYDWEDTNTDPTLDGNGVLDATDKHTRVQIAVGTDEMDNFANWLQYWSHRMHATKSVLGNIINKADATRMGLNWMNNSTHIDVSSMTDETDKLALLTELYTMNPSGGTPARSLMNTTGTYFQSTGTSAPILPALDGGECQQNFAVLLTDGFYNENDVTGVGNRDKDGQADDTEFDGNASQSNDGGNYADDLSDTASDIAMKFYEADLRTDLDDNVPQYRIEDNNGDLLPGSDGAEHQHLSWYVVPFGVTGELDPDTDDPTDPGFPGWPGVITKNDGSSVDDLWHAAYNSRGLFLSATDPEELIESLDSAVRDVAKRTAVAAAVSASSSRLSTDTTVYVAEFNTNGWQGNLFGYKIADTDTGELATTTIWGGDTGVADLLDARDLDTNPRTILTYKGTDGIPFQWANLTTGADSQRHDMRTDENGAKDTGDSGIARLAFIRGDRSNEGVGYGFRQRQTRMGDTGHAGPVHVAAPDLSWPDTAPFPTAAGKRYSEFKEGAAASRDPIIYMPANDGMIHGFRESDGEEVIAYIPSTLYSAYTVGKGLHYLTEPGYKHIYYNDLTPTVSDIYADLGSGDQWSTIIIGGQRGGGRGIYALDVTDPSSFGEDGTKPANTVLWEFDSNDDADLNYTFSKPQIALANNGQWVAIFGNGYDENSASLDGRSKLFILDIEKGLDGTWSVGDYIKIDTGQGSTGDPNGLSSPTLADLDGDGTVDRVYAGDLRGNLYAFDLSSTNSASWSVGRLFDGDPSQPITSAPSIAKHPSIGDSGSNAPNVMVYFGSGQLETSSDLTDTGAEQFRGVWDKGDTGILHTNLVTQTFDSSFSGARVVTNSPVDYAGGVYGWDFILPDSGERSLTRSVVRGDAVYFNSYVPEDDPCTSGGYGYRFAVNLLTGGSPRKVTTDANEDGKVNNGDLVNNGTDDATVAAIKQDGYLPEPVFIEDIVYTADKPSKIVPLESIQTGRYSWQELVQ